MDIEWPSSTNKGTALAKLMHQFDPNRMLVDDVSVRRTPPERCQVSVERRGASDRSCASVHAAGSPSNNLRKYQYGS
jgi:hypothetical protein